jgi:hypothetical protein
MPKVTITFKIDGTMTTDVEGARGQSCVRTTEQLLNGLAHRTVTSRPKQEYYVNEANNSVGV